MATCGLKKIGSGFNVLYNGSSSKWNLTIGSTVAIEKRDRLEAYHLLISENGTVNASITYDENGPKLNLTRTNYVVPDYVKSIAFDIMSKGNINDYLDEESVDNEFTRLGSAR